MIEQLPVWAQVAIHTVYLGPLLATLTIWGLRGAKRQLDEETEEDWIARGWGS